MAGQKGVKRTERDRRAPLYAPTPLRKHPLGRKGSHGQAGGKIAAATLMDRSALCNGKAWGALLKTCSS